jgi:septum formation protein
MQQIILASASPRRKELLERLGLEFSVVESGYDESLIQTEDVVELVEELALQKALLVAQQYDDAIVIGGDTVVYVAGEIIGKPKDKQDAERMIRLLSGTTHMIVSGVAVVNSLTGEHVGGHEEGWIRFRELSESEIATYIASGAWKGFAGGYAMQGVAAPFVAEQTGSLSGIIGLPVVLVVDLLEQMDVPIEIDPKELEIEIRDQKVGIEEA